MARPEKKTGGASASLIVSIVSAALALVSAVAAGAFAIGWLGGVWGASASRINTAVDEGVTRLQEEAENRSLDTRVNTLELSTLPAGTIIAYGAQQQMRGNWLPCDGTPLPIPEEYLPVHIRPENPEESPYEALYEAIGKSWGGTETHFCLPDLRGRFVRGVTPKPDPNKPKNAPVNKAAARDPEADGREACQPGGEDGRSVGSIQEDAFQGHWHTIHHQALGSGHSAGLEYQPAAPDDREVWHGSRGIEVRSPKADGVNGPPRPRKETRPKNAYVNFIIKY